MMAGSGRWMGIAMTGLLMTGCAPGLSDRHDSSDESLHSMRAAVEARERGARSALARGAVDIEAVGRVRRMEGDFYGARGYRNVTGDPLPADLEAADGLTLIGNRPLALPEVASLITEHTGLPVRLALDRQPTAGDIDVGTAYEGDMLGGMVQPVGAAGASRIRPHWQGPLSSILDLIAAHFGVHWSYRHGTIAFFLHETRQYQLISLPVDTSGLAQLSGGGSGGGGDSGGHAAQTSLTAESASRTAIWEEVVATVESMLPDGARVAASPTTGTVTVTAPRDVLSTVERYMDAINADLAREVEIEVKVYSVALSRDDNYGFDLDLILRDQASGFQVGLPGGAEGMPTGAPATSIGVVSPPAGSSLVGFDGSSLIVNALSRRGRVSQVTQARGRTLNNVPLPLQDARQTSYLREITVTTATTTTGGSTGLSPGTVTTGFSMVVLPRIRQDNTVVIHFTLNLSDLRELRNVESGGQRIQVPEIDSRGFQQQAMLRSGETLVLAGFETESDALGLTGRGAASFFGLGGGVMGDSTRTLLVVLLTPRVIRQ